MSETSSDDDTARAVALFILIDQKRKKRKRSCWSREWLCKRPRHGAYSCLLPELLNEDPQATKTFLRMTDEVFQELLQLVGPHIAKQHTVMREAIKPGERLAITLRYLGSGNTFTDLKYLFRVSDNTIRSIVLETCKAIYDNLNNVYLKVPTSPAEWKKISKDFEDRWNFPNCIGAIDGKHIPIASPNEGSKYFNYKGFHSIILLAAVDANYKFLYVDVGANGRAGDAGVFRDSPMMKGLEEGTLGIPDPAPLPGRKDPVPFFLVGDDAFPLKPYLMKPYPFRSIATQNSEDGEDAEAERKKQRIFDYRLSRARRTSENAFGILGARFGVLQHAIRMTPENATTVTQACLALHNFLLAKKDIVFAAPCFMVRENNVTHDVLPGDWRQNQQARFQGLARQAGNNSQLHARQARNEVKEYVNGEGGVPWQEQLVFGRVL